MDLIGKGAIKKRKIREFQSSLLDENIFKGWLAPSHQENTAMCTVTNSSGQQIILTCVDFYKTAVREMVKRNRLSNDTVSAICIVRSSIQAENIEC
ncbi:hypothetical protein ALC57_05317 [Trachymyrmex cornetzi]|uniref:Uncharacterized protein n=1 Tax=Trachymyrmex cornetzi TaxID=471704 RepID=A0A151JAV2_9HYME|nr:hypothetical protein ALC57_05317 [Trachymyrmex cornetzi]